jgi:hypothetical protein
MHDELLSRVKELLSLPATATLQQVTNAQQIERQRRAEPLPGARRRST